jgi:predicted exporter
MLRKYRTEILHSLAVSLTAILVLLAVALRSVPAMLRVVTPMLSACAVTAAAMMELFGGLNLYHLVSLLLVMGLSLDQALFFNRPAESGEERRRTLLSLLVCSSSAITAFGILATSEINILRAIGSTVAVGAFFALTFAWLAADSRTVEPEPHALH